MTTCNLAVSTEVLILLFRYYRSQRLVANGSPSGSRSRSVPAPIVASVPPDTNGLGYTGMSYLHTTVKTLAIATTVNRTFYPPSFEAVALADCPLSRLTILSSQQGAETAVAGCLAGVSEVPSEQQGPKYCPKARLVSISRCMDGKLRILELSSRDQAGLTELLLQKFT